MDLNKEIKNGFETFVKKTFKNDEIKRFLINHERRNILEDNLMREIKMSYHIIKDAYAIKKCIKQFSAMFCKAALDLKEKELKTKVFDGNLFT